MALLLLLQFVLPAVLIMSIAVAPAPSRVGFVVQVGATVLGLIALAVTGLWTVLPWWTPVLFAAVFVLALVVGARRRARQRPRAGALGGTETESRWLPAGWRQWLSLALFAVLGVALGSQVAAGLDGRRWSGAERTVDLAWPLGTGSYLVVNGGSTTAVNAHVTTLDPSVARYRAYRGQSYGVDIVALNSLGLRAAGLQPADPGHYAIYGAPVVAPCSGRVVAAVDGIPDMSVPQVDRANMAGNHVIIACDDVHVVLAHFRPGSLRVETGATVSVGDAIAEVGNSGNTSEPHLHIHAQLPGSADEPLSGDPLPISLSGSTMSRNDRRTVP